MDTESPRASTSNNVEFEEETLHTEDVLGEVDTNMSFDDCSDDSDDNEFIDNDSEVEDNEDISDDDDVEFLVCIVFVLLTQLVRSTSYFCVR